MDNFIYVACAAWQTTFREMLRTKAVFTQQVSNWIKARIRLDRHHDTWWQQMERCEATASECMQLTYWPLQIEVKVHLGERGRERGEYSSSVLGGNCRRLNKQTNNQFPSSLSRIETSKLCSNGVQAHEGVCARSLWSTTHFSQKHFNHDV